MSAAQPTVLFLCADNSVRSQLGEALLRHRAGARFEAWSAGLTPRPVHPLVREVLREVGLEDAPLTAKPITPFLGKRAVRYAVILRESDETDAPRIYPFAARTMRWEVRDPVSSDDATDEDALERFRKVRDVIDAHLRGWIAEIDATEGGKSAA